MTVVDFALTVDSTHTEHEKFYVLIRNCRGLAEKLAGYLIKNALLRRPSATSNRLQAAARRARRYSSCGLLGQHEQTVHYFIVT